MAWKHNGRTIQVGRSWVDDSNIKHPPNWTIWTDDYKKTRGLIWEDDPVVEKFDERFYISKGVERSLADVNVVDDDGKVVNDPVTGKQMVSLGLKSTCVTKTKATANSLLSSSDWYVTRKAETSTAIPSDISTYRTDVRAASKTIEDKINGCANLDAFIALFEEPKDSDEKVTGKAPMYDFPDEV